MSPSSKTKKRSYIKGGKVKKPKSKICKTCGDDTLENERRDMMKFSNKLDQSRAKEYCKEHELKYSYHKCKPSWCGDCGYLTKYQIEIQKR
jgi:hypothetical protein